MNRLVIIGNGFDLAHGLPTSYKDFIVDYVVEKANLFQESGFYEDSLISFSSVQGGRSFKKVKFVTIAEVDRFFEDPHWNFECKSSLFGILKEKLETVSWLDVESEYFQSVLNCKNPKGVFDNKKLEKLNEEFDYLKETFEAYLQKINLTNTKEKARYRNAFCEEIKKEDTVFKEIKADVLPDKVLFLNFNYTATINKYIRECNNKISTDVNFIHGELGNSENPIIFGFGDEYDKNYREFEDLKNNSLFKHIKSFNYFKTQNYHDLIRFIEADDFQVYIFGHSCGLSDRTMLKEIFENEKCISIKIYYYKIDDKVNDYVEKTMEISRHFEDKGLMRKKIVPFPLCDAM